MKTMLTLLTVAMLGGWLTACGGTNRNPSTETRTSGATTVADSGAPNTTAPARPPGTYLESDGDEDPDEVQKGPSTDDKGGTVAVGYGASRADKKAITAAVRSYYAAATAGDGTKGCSLLSASLATATAEESSSGGSGACAESLSRQFKEQHQRLAAEDYTTMVITGVHVKGAEGLATLGFNTALESEIALLREGRKWKIDALFDSALP